MLEVTFRDPGDLDRLGAQWQAFEAQVTCSFFQSWAWVGCLAQDRFTDPILIEARRDGRLVALALFNRGRSRFGRARLWLGETGQPAWDSVFIEHNGALVAAGDDDALRGCLALALQRHTVVLSGIGAAQQGAAESLGAACVARQTRLAPYVDLAALAAAGIRHVDLTSANTRYQIRRSARFYAADGALLVTPAGSAEERRDYLRELAVLHQKTWVARGRPGAFAVAEFVRFHTALIDRTSAVDLLRVTAGDRVIGYLHNFCHRGRVSAYQSGFDYPAGGSQARPGLTCHALAIEHYLARGMREYDFLAGDDRYKTSLATHSAPLHWLTLTRRWSLQGAAAQLKTAVRRARAMAWPGD